MAPQVATEKTKVSSSNISQWTRLKHKPVDLPCTCPGSGALRGERWLLCKDAQAGGILRSELAGEGGGLRPGLAWTCWAWLLLVTRQPPYLVPFTHSTPTHTPLSTSLLPSWGPEVSEPLGLLISLKTSCSKFKAKAEQQPHLFSGSLRLKQ